MTSQNKKRSSVFISDAVTKNEMLEKFSELLTFILVLKEAVGFKTDLKCVSDIYIERQRLALLWY